MYSLFITLVIGFALFFGKKKKFFHLPPFPNFVLHISHRPVSSLSPESFVFSGAVIDYRD